VTCAEYKASLFITVGVLMAFMSFAVLQLAILDTHLNLFYF